MQALQLAVGVVGWFLISCVHWLVGVVLHYSGVGSKPPWVALGRLSSIKNRPSCLPSAGPAWGLVCGPVNMPEISSFDKNGN